MGYVGNRYRFGVIRSLLNRGNKYNALLAPIK